MLSGDDRDRTGNLLVANQALLQLSATSLLDSFDKGIVLYGSGPSVAPAAMANMACARLQTGGAGFTADATVVGQLLNYGSSLYQSFVLWTRQSYCASVFAFDSIVQEIRNTRHVFS
jgi:hypothetical protein